MQQTFNLAALLGLIFLSCCGERAIKQAAHDKAIIEASKVLPDLPAGCRRHTQTGVRVGDGLDAAALKIRKALKRQYARTDQCAKWYDDLQAGYVGP